MTELNRFARVCEIKGDVLLCPRHKSGDPHRTQVSKAVLAAARRTRSAGGFSVSRFYGEVAKACEKEGIEPFRPGGYRHTVATHAVQSGETPERVAHFLGHKGSYMAKAIYAKAAVPKKIATMA